MIKEMTGIRGKVEIRKFTFPKGNDRILLAERDELITHRNKRMVRIFDREYLKQLVVNHNIVTNHGDALIADLMAQTPAQTKVDNTSGVIGVGTGFTAEAKTVTALVTQTGSNEAMDATYPKLKGAFNATDDNVVQYRSTFEAGDLIATGIDEAALGNAIYLLAYAEVTPVVNMTASDTLQVDWELTLLGA